MPLPASLPLCLVPPSDRKDEMSYIGPEQWNAENEDAFDAVAEERLEPKAGTCMCDTTEEGWRPCPPSLCERTDHAHEAG